ncbi:Rossmann-fold NAD(P)-binding domain-containing protein [Myroides sp. LJL116]
MRIIIIGGTGATGMELTTQLLLDDRVEEVQIILRKKMEYSHPKLKQYVLDFDQMQHWDTSFIQGADIAFCALGTTLKQAGSKSNFYKIDYSYVTDFASICRSLGVNCFSLVSSKGANSKSALFYFRIKGQVEQAILALNFPKTVFIRPGSLIRPGSTRNLEKLTVQVSKFITSIGLFKSSTPVSVKGVAQALISESLSDSIGVRIIENIDIVNLEASEDK